MPATRNPLLREQPWNEPQHLRQLYDITPVDYPFVPRDIEEATDFILASKPPEVAAYDGSPEVQRSVAYEIASTLFGSEAPAGNGEIQLEKASQRPTVEDLLPPSPNARRLVVSELIARTAYRASITPVERLTAAAE